MSGVVLRCPNCGTTQAAAGECEACHEASVKYHCTNHKPGLWPDGPKCTKCGARFGERAAPPPASPPRPTGYPAASTRRPPPPRPASSRPEPDRSPAAGPAAEPPRSSRMPWGAKPTSGGSKPRRGTEEVTAPADADPLGRLRDLLEAARRSGRAAPRPREVARSPEPMGPPPGAQLLGCLFRAVLLIFVVLVLITIAVVGLVGGGLMEMLGPLLYQLMREF